MSETLEVELDQLVSVATKTLPGAAGHLRAAAKQAHQVSAMSPSGFHGDLLTEVGQSWSKAETFLVEALVRSSLHLADSADGLVDIAKRYGYDESEARDKLAGLDFRYSD